MTSSVEKALQLPEVLDVIAYWIPLFEFEFPSYHSSLCCEDYDKDSVYAYRPRYLLSCTLVSRLWNSCFTPHLYHYFIGARRSHVFCISKHNSHGFQKNYRHVRRVLSQCNFIDFPFTTESMPRNLVSFHCESSQLLSLNQGSRLKHLYWSGTISAELMNLPCLEKLELSNCCIDNIMLYRLLRKCSGTLRELKVVELRGIDSRLPYYDGHGYTKFSDDHRQSPEWSLPHVKSLTMRLDHQESKASVLLPCLCPALESIRIMMGREIRSMPQLVSSLRDHCPKLHTVSLQASRRSYSSLFLNDHQVCAPLFKDSCPQGLRSASISLPRGLDHPTRDALLFHANTLVILELQSVYDMYRDENATEPMSMKAVLQLLACCKHLRNVRLWNISCDLSSVDTLFATPWGCRDLEELVIAGYHTIETSQLVEYQDHLVEESQRGQEQFQLRSERKPPHHEYRDDGQGWFLKHGLKKDELLEALAYSDWKRQLFEHMYTTSGIRQAKYVRLNTIEFFARDPSPERMLEV